MTTLAAQWQDLSDQQDALFADPDLTDRQARVNELRNAVLVWEMVQLDIQMGTEYEEDDLRNYKRAAERAARWLEGKQNATHDIMR